MTDYTLIQKRQDTAANWTSADTVLSIGEEGYETDTGRSKIGDGATAWSDVPYGDRTAYRACTGTTGDGSTDDRAALASSDTSAVSASLPLMLLPGTYRVASNLTIASPVWFTPGAVLKPDNGVTVTLSGGVMFAPDSQIFDCSAGGVIGLGVTRGPVTAKWWGATGDGVTDDTDALQAWLEYLVPHSAIGWLPNGTYLITSTLVAPSGVTAGGWGWGIQGENENYTIIQQDTDDTPVLQIGDTAGSSRCSLENFMLTYTDAQSSSNTSAINLYFEGPTSGDLSTVYWSTFRHLRFLNGYYAMKTPAGKYAPWGCEFDMLTMGTMSGGFYDNTGSIGGCPNNRWGRITLNCSGAVGPIFKDWRAYNMTVGAVEFLVADQGPQLITTASGFTADIGSMKLEIATYTGAGTFLFDFTGRSFVRIGHISVGGTTATFTPSGGVLAVVAMRGTTGIDESRIEINSMELTASSLSGTCVALYGGGLPNCRISVGTVRLANGWTLQYTGGSTHGDYITVRSWVNHALSDDQGDADYTVTLGHPNVVHFATAFTAQRTITLPSKTSNNLCYGLYYDLVFDGAINGSNTAVIKEGSNTLRTQTVDQKILRYVWRRNAVGSGVWVLVSINDIAYAETIEVGHATDTTITRVSAGKIAVEGVNVVTTSSSDTLTNKTLTSPALNTATVGTSLTLNDAANIIANATTGSKIGTATSQKIGVWNATPIVQPTTAVAEGTFVENSGGTAVNVDSTIDGYTLQQVVKALRNIGLLA